MEALNKVVKMTLEAMRKRIINLKPKRFKGNILYNIYVLAIK